MYGVYSEQEWFAGLRKQAARKAEEVSREAAADEWARSLNAAFGPVASSVPPTTPVTEVRRTVRKEVREAEEKRAAFFAECAIRAGRAWAESKARKAAVGRASA